MGSERMQVAHCYDADENEMRSDVTCASKEKSVEMRLHAERQMERNERYLIAFDLLRSCTSFLKHVPPSHVMRDAHPPRTS